jgi:hypothetical protein
MRAPLLLALFAAGCSGDLAGPPARLTLPAGAQAAKRSTVDPGMVVIDDVLDRLLPALDAETASELRGPLTAIRAALTTDNDGAVDGAAAVAAAVLSRAIAENDEYVADLTAISVSLDAAALK